MILIFKKHQAGKHDGCLFFVYIAYLIPNLMKRVVFVYIAYLTPNLMKKCIFDSTLGLFHLNLTVCQVCELDD